ncbi:hydroxyproline dehydrogenase isoform X1 [Monodelphis domestica]|uniref:hydroxyproline dehydrogenase isoform X1 n=1 Tax=Monodelphis domestica TaxID=13616 RepID=UPI0024E24B21|nr:hydroxyproline dehydrogenase isoform X1 [Monodelphis domestica]
MLRTSRVLLSRVTSPLQGSGAQGPILRFDGEAFRLKKTRELVRALLVLRLCAWPPLVTYGLTLLSWSQRLLGSRLSGALLRASVYGQFVAGETAAEVQGSVQRLQGLRLRPLLAVPTEEEPGTRRGGEAWYEENLDAMLHCVDLSCGPPGSPPPRPALMQLKVTALTSARLCRELSLRLQEPGTAGELRPERLATAMERGQDLSISSLSPEQNQHLRASLNRFHRIAQYARAQGVRLLVDAEYTFLNPALSLFVAALAVRWNCPEEADGDGAPWVWNTYQAYLQDTYERLHGAAEAAERAGLAFGVKLVRGAYLETERALAQQSGAADPTQPNYEATSRSYSRCLELMLGHVCRRGSRCQLMVASHNEESVRQAVKRMSDLGIPPDGAVCFGQLLGMCDHVSLALGQAGYSIYKSIPYGSLEEVIPYLLRRAQENRSVLQGARREQELLSQELLRRWSRRP